MQFTRRKFIRSGAAAFSVGFAAPAVLCDLARAQGLRGRNLVVLYLSGGNDALSTVVPYTDPAYYRRRPAISIPAEAALQVGSDNSGKPLALHPNLTGLRSIFDMGQLSIIQRTGYPDTSRSHFRSADIWSTANPNLIQGTGWLGRYLDTLSSPVDPLVAWNSARLLPRSLQAATGGVPSIPNPGTYAYAGMGAGVQAEHSRAAAAALSSHVSVLSPQFSFVNSTAQAALATLGQVGAVANYTPTVDYPGNGLGGALRAVAGALATEVGTKVFWVQTGGYDTHAGQGRMSGNYPNLLRTLDDGLSAFHTDLSNQGLLGQTLLLLFSEFGRRVSENGSAGTDHGAGGLMMALGGTVNGGLYGTAADLDHTPDNPTLENNGRDVAHETDFRSVYARVIDNWLGANSVAILRADFRNQALSFV